VGDLPKLRIEELENPIEGLSISFACAFDQQRHLSHAVVPST